VGKKQISIITNRQNVLEKILSDTDLAVSWSDKVHQSCYTRVTQHMIDVMYLTSLIHGCTIGSGKRIGADFQIAWSLACGIT